MAGSAAGITGGGAGAGTAACVVGVLVGGGATATCVVGVVTGVIKPAGTTGDETFFAAAVAALFILVSCTLRAASAASTAAVAVGRGAAARSDRAKTEVLSASVPEARAIASTTTTVRRPRRVHIDLTLPAARFRGAVRPAPEEVVESGGFVWASTMC